MSLIVERLDDEVLVYDQTTQEAHRLGGDAAIEFEAAGDDLSRREVIRRAGLTAAAAAGAGALMRTIVAPAAAHAQSPIPCGSTVCNPAVESCQNGACCRNAGGTCTTNPCCAGLTCNAGFCAVPGTCQPPCTGTDICCPGPPATCRAAGSVCCGATICVPGGVESCENGTCCRNSGFSCTTNPCCSSLTCNGSVCV